MKYWFSYRRSTRIPWKKQLVSAFTILGTFTASAFSMELQSSIQEKILNEFPGSTIEEVRNDTYRGHEVLEVEIITASGLRREITLSEEGKILHVEEEKELPWIGGELLMGLAVRGESGIYKGGDSEFQITPFLRYENGSFELQAYDSIDATYTFLQGNTYYAALRGNVEIGDGYDPDDSSFLTGMDELDTVYGAGLEIGADYGGLNVSLELLQDISGEHDGQQIELAVSKSFFAAGFSLRPELSLTWMSEEVVDYFVGVSEHESRPDRPVYAPGSSYELEAELLATRPLFGDFSLMLLFGVAYLGGDITDSPLVEEDYEFEGAIGIAYTF